jgi:hypothetical protein
LKRRPSFVESAVLRLEDEPKYRVLLYQRGTPDQFEWNKTELYGFLAPHLRSKTDAADAVSEADQKGSASRTIEYALGHTARVVILRVRP